VERISYDAPVKAHLDVAYRAVRTDLVFSYSGGVITGLDGRGAAIALIDTGVQSHVDFKRPKGYPQPIEVEIVGRESGMADYYGHGTHVAGILNGSGYASSDSLSFRTFRGLAPGAQLISVRALQPDGTGTTSDIIRGIDWVVQNRQTYKIRVLNLSLGHPVYESYKDDPLCRAAAQAVNQGIVVVAAAGNDGTAGTGFGTITSPANDPSVITVGAMQDFNTVTTIDDVLAGYSSKGPTLVDFVAKPDLVAPGTWIVSARATASYIDKMHHDLVLKVGEYRNDTRYAASDGVYLTMAGTSMAAPMVAATAALMIQKEPGLNPATVKARLMRSAVKDDRLVFETGAGYLDVHAAVNATGYADKPYSPLLLVAEDGGVYMQDTARIWGGDWPLGYIWGDLKGRASGIVLSDVPGSITATYGYIWGGKAASVSLVDNSQVTASGAIWTGRGSSLSGTSGMVVNDGSIWGWK
jgi:serine protease AprX